MSAQLLYTRRTPIAAGRRTIDSRRNLTAAAANPSGEGKGTEGKSKREAKGETKGETKGATKGYYEVVNGKKMDRALLEVAKESTEGKGDGRISLEDAKMLLAAVKDGNSYTDIEKDSVAYIRKTYSFTEAADKWFRWEIKSWATKKGWETRKKNDAFREAKDAGDLDKDAINRLQEIRKDQEGLK